MGVADHWRTGIYMGRWDVPAARTDMAVAERTDGAIVLTEPGSAVTHSLDPHAAAVWRACDGVRDRSAIARLTGLSPLQVAVIVDRLVALGLTERLRVTTAEVVDLAAHREKLGRTAPAADTAGRTLRLV